MQITCKDTFYLSDGACVPQCGRWKISNDETAVAVAAIVFISAIIGLGSGILVMILSCIWRKKM